VPPNLSTFIQEIKRNAPHITNAGLLQTKLLLASALTIAIATINAWLANAMSSF